MQSDPRPGRNDQGRRVLDAMRLIVQGLRQSSQGLEQRHGVSASQLFVLRALAGGTPLSIGELAERTMTHQSSVSVVAAKLVAARLARRARSTVDARRVELTATEAGRRLAAIAPDPFQERLVEGLARLTVAQRRALVAGLESWVAAMGLGERPGMFFEPVTKAKKRARS